MNIDDAEQETERIVANDLTVRYLPRVRNIVYRIASKYRGFVDAEDLLQDCQEWCVRRPDKIVEWLSPDDNDKPLNEAAFILTMRRHAERAARRAKAAMVGYELGDEYFYTPEIIVALLKTMWANSDTLIVDNDMEVGRRGSHDPAEGPDLPAMLMDVRRVWPLLTVAQQELLVDRHYEEMTLADLASWHGTSITTISRRESDAVNKLIDGLGGPSPYKGRR